MSAEPQPKHTEICFEDAIELALLARGYTKGFRDLFDADHALFPADVIAYIEGSQPKKWQSLVDLQGTAAEQTLLDALVKELGAKGALFCYGTGSNASARPTIWRRFSPPQA